MKITKEQMLQQGYIFNDEGEGYSESLKDKCLDEERLMSTGHYFDNGDAVHFWWTNKDGAEFEREDFPE